MATKKYKDGDAVLFIDANAYLQFYGSPKSKDLIKTLIAQQNHIFITSQIVAEVQRNKLNVVARLFKDLEQEAKDEGVQTLPIHLLDETSRKNRHKDSEAAKLFHGNLSKDCIRILGEVSRSEDLVSLALKPIFKAAEQYTEDQLRKAKTRKKMGNPPGKHDDPIGDELTWEQLLSHLRDGKGKGKSALWIITDDTDYITKHDKKNIFLNAFLRSELPPSMEVFCFDNVGVGIADFANMTGEGKGELPSRDKLDVINQEIATSASEAWLSTPLSSSAVDFLVLQNLQKQKRDRETDLLATVKRLLIEGRKAPEKTKAQKTEDEEAPPNS